MQPHSEEPGVGSQEAEENKRKTKQFVIMRREKWTSRKQLVNIILHKTNSGGTAKYSPFLEVTPSAFMGGLIGFLMK